MSNEREFIAAKDLPVSEAEEVDVLCVENGELKRKTGASLGGRGVFDVVIWSYSSMDKPPVLVIGDYKTIKDKMESGSPIFGLLAIDRCWQDDNGNWNPPPYSQMDIDLISRINSYDEGVITLATNEGWYANLYEDNRIETGIYD